MMSHATHQHGTAAPHSAGPSSPTVGPSSPRATDIATGSNYYENAPMPFMESMAQPHVVNSGRPISSYIIEPDSSSDAFSINSGGEERDTDADADGDSEMHSYATSMSPSVTDYAYEK